MRSNARQVINKMKKAIEKTMKDAPKVLGLEGQRHFQENFAKQSFEGKRWKQVQRRTPGTYAYEYPKRKFLSRRTNPILVGRTRRLKNSLNRSFKSGSSSRMRWEVILPYAQVQNKGNRKIPARSFMRPTQKFQNRLKKKFGEMLKQNLGR